MVIGDRVLIAPDKNKEKTGTGLYLPQGLSEKEKIHSGYVIKTGPGYILPHVESEEPWSGTKKGPQYIPLQINEGDYAIFLRKEAVEIEYEKTKYLIIPQSGILAVIREEIKLPQSDEF